MQSVNLISDARYTDDKPHVLHAVKTDQLLVDAVYLKPGQRTGWRKIADADRAFLCVQGQGELVLETTAVGNELRALPGGRYSIEAWHEQLGRASQSVQVGDGASATLDFALPQ